MKRALISVSNKEGIVEFARGLQDLGWELISTGGTYNTLNEAGVKVTKVAEVTGFPEILDGRVKTLHPKIHGGILARRVPDHLKQLEDNAIAPIDLVAVNLYPFRDTINRPGVTKEEAVENIDIGGPAMVRAAAKNHQDVIIVVRPDYYTEILTQLRNGGDIAPDLRLRLAREAFSHTAAYDAMISNYLTGLTGEQFTDSFILAGEKVYDLRYGENPHQAAGFYRDLTSGSGLTNAVQLQGKELSYNNIVDAEAAWQLAVEIPEPACVIIKHTNPCGTALGENLAQAYERAFSADPTSAYGGIIAFNRVVDEAAAQKAAGPFMEVIIAPGFTAEARELFAVKKNLRLLEMDIAGDNYWQLKTVAGGFVLQEKDKDSAADWHVVTAAQPDPKIQNDLALAWTVVKHVKSNAIVIVKDGQTWGVGAGQMNRVGAAQIALTQAKDKAQGAVMASDAYFPFRDTVELAAEYGVKAIIQPGGSIRDEESIEACNQAGIAMIFTGVRHFRH